MNILRKIKNVYHWVVAWIAHAYYGFPARKLKLIGITGTDGKTTTSSLIYHILKSAGKKVSVITTVSATIGGKSHDTGFHVTTPDPHRIPKYLFDAVKNGDEYMVFEITSHALDQHRAAPLRFLLSGITNITHEHLDYHKTMDGYIAAKAKLVRLSQKTFINGDQKEVAAKIKTIATGCQMVTYGLEKENTHHEDIGEKFGLNLEHYNKYNFLLAYLICKDLGISDSEFKNACGTYIFPPGRMETVYDKDFTVIIDFAHTPNAIDQALSAVSKRYPQRYIIHVFGAAGKRDISKRKEMGEASGKYASLIILTEEDHRDEDPQQIANMIAEGVRKMGFAYVSPTEIGEARNQKMHLYTYVANRSDAIKLAISLTHTGDIVIATGKAHEGSLCRGVTEFPYNEKATVLACINS